MASCRQNGKKIYGYGLTIEEASAALKRRLAPTLSIDNSTFHEFATQIWYKEIETLEPKSIDRYTGLYRNYIRDTFAKVPLGQITSLTVREWMRGLESRGSTGQTIRSATSLLGSICNLALSYDLMLKNPCAMIKLPKKSPKRERQIPIDKAEHILKSLIGSDLAAPVFFCLFLGLRRGEILGLRWHDLDRIHGTLSISRQRQFTRGGGANDKSLKTESSKRVLRLSRGFVTRIDELGNLDSEFICTFDGRPWVPNNVGRQWRYVRGNFDLEDWTFHDLRHGAAGLLYAAGADMLEISAILGHAKPDMSLLYTSIDQGKTASALAKLSSALDN